MLPRKCQENLSADLRVDRKHRSAFFELVVARMLQELGASIACEPDTSVGKTKIDFLAQFADHTVAVEATSPVFSKATAPTARNRNRLTDFVEECKPAGWLVAIAGLPDIGPQDSVKQFKDAVKRMLDVPPPTVGQEKRELRRRFPQGDIRLKLLAESTFGRKGGVNGIVHEAPLPIADDSEQVIRKAVKDKYRQARNVEVPALVAVGGQELFTRLQDFDMALFGHYRIHLDDSMSFKADGVFARKKEGESTIAGVLAFTELGIFRCSEPVLYVHPRFSGILPDALRHLEQRKLVSDRSGIQRLEARKRGFLKALEFPGSDA